MTSRVSKARASFDDVLAAVKPVERSVRICVDGSILAEIDALNEQLERETARDHAENRAPVAPQIAKRIVELTEKSKDSEVEFVFRAIGRKAWSDLVAAHPPRPEDKKAGLDFNPDTYHAAAVAASCIEPVGVTPESAQRLLDILTESQAASLWMACLHANRGSSEVPFSGAAFEIARPTETNSESPETTESREASSLAE